MPYFGELGKIKELYFFNYINNNYRFREFLFMFYSIPFQNRLLFAFNYPWPLNEKCFSKSEVICIYLGIQPKYNLTLSVVKTLNYDIIEMSSLSNILKNNSHNYILINTFQLNTPLDM